MLMSLKYCFARQIPQTVPFLESKQSGLRSLWTAPSLSSLQCCSSSVSHHDFTHLAINLGPCVLGCTGCEPGRLLGWNLQSARFCSSCTDTDERWELFFLVNPMGIPADLLSSRLSWVSPSSASFDQGWSHTGGYAQWTLWSEQQHPQWEGWHRAVKLKLGVNLTRSALIQQLKSHISSTSCCKVLR